ncbi:histone acetyltransferase ASCRUDRAFT_83243 [Ascoidea rubescens DSM 1968]|uniref:Transcription initiation factor TFIID subunit 1 histone acetyltransferase domain-containing protein n=1 Tax=Ascoidea rubescens DSM 1968 TaxID=1344418 RepID=A0A1D2VNU6_9ASCO|nr:hypothetical protein ASCRUDRAFT_83243 [Ascoidea rubescens DSM 1968]ODV63264.1 hypothetical protein ASCRUDRAFT_83243 [Ascoidea rubescens DSM 1968]
MSNSHSASTTSKKKNVIAKDDVLNSLLTQVDGFNPSDAFNLSAFDPSKLVASGSTKHAANAIDFEDEDELADDDEPLLENSDNADSTNPKSNIDELATDSFFKSLQDEPFFFNQNSSQNFMNDDFTSLFGDTTAISIQNSSQNLNKTASNTDINHTTNNTKVPFEGLHLPSTHGITDFSSFSHSNNNNIIIGTNTNNKNNNSSKNNINNNNYNDHNFNLITNEESFQKKKQELLHQKELQRLRELKKNDFYLSYYYPGFNKNSKKLPLSSLFGSKPYFFKNSIANLNKDNAKPLIPTKINMEIDIDQIKIFNKTQSSNIKQVNQSAQINDDSYLGQKIIHLDDLDYYNIYLNSDDKNTINKKIDSADNEISKINTKNHNKIENNFKILEKHPKSNSHFDSHSLRKKQKIIPDIVTNDLILATSNWDDTMIFGIDDLDDSYQLLDSATQKNTSIKIQQNSTNTNTNTTSNNISILEDRFPYDNSFDESDYDLIELDENSQTDNDDIEEHNYFKKEPKLKLDLNDSKLLFLSDSIKKISKSRFHSTRRNQINKRDPQLLSQIPINEKQLAMRFNFSNDTQYQILNENYHSKIRTTIGNLQIDHSAPALKLQSPYYPVKLTKQEMRYFHRPRFLIRSNTVMKFSKVKLRKRKTYKNKDIKEVFNKTADLSLGDSLNYVLLEYSEEMPLILSKFGMGSKIINYYRKITKEDTKRPKLPIGETQVLGVQDRSPFWNFGFVNNGQIVPTLYNKMVRSPIFRHEAKSTDFLLIRQITHGQNARYFLRSIPFLFVVGQLFPVVEVPSPHSRKVTAVSKNRLKMIVFRALNKSEYHRLSLRDISSHFPDQNDMQNRQRLKEFMEYQRTGFDQGFWKIKNNDIVLPEFEEIRSMITPEDITLLESMQVGQQYNEDSLLYNISRISLENFEGLIRFINDNNGGDFLKNKNWKLTISQINQLQKALNDIKNSDENERNEHSNDHNENNNSNSNYNDEDEKAPWNLTKNFIIATQGKAMLQIHGEMDPTGISEGFSFLKTSMKGGFKTLDEYSSNSPFVGTPGNNSGSNSNKKEGSSKGGKSGHSYSIASQQKAYDDEIKRVWESQARSLSNDNINEIIENQQNLSNQLRFLRFEANRIKHEKVLKITRLIKDSNGMLQRKAEVIKDSRIINAYLLRKEEQFQEKLLLLSSGGSGHALGLGLGSGTGNLYDFDLNNIKAPSNLNEKKILEQHLEILEAERKKKGSGQGRGRRKRGNIKSNSGVNLNSRLTSDDINRVGVSHGEGDMYGNNSIESNVNEGIGNNGSMIEDGALSSLGVNTTYESSNGLGSREETAESFDKLGMAKSGKGIGKGRNTNRKCATCGAVGHIKTNKNCPFYYTKGPGRKDTEIDR